MNLLLNIISNFIKVLDRKISPFYFNHFANLFRHSNLDNTFPSSDSFIPIQTLSTKDILSTSWSIEKCSGNPSIAIATFDLLNRFIWIGFVFYKGNCFLSTYNKIPYNSLYLHEYILDWMKAHFTIYVLFLLIVSSLYSCKSAKLSDAEEKQRIGEYYEAAAIYRKVYTKTSAKRGDLRGDIG